MKTAGLIFILMLSGMASGSELTTRLAELNSQWSQYCQFFASDVQCGGTEVNPLSAQHQDNRNRVHRVTIQLAESILDSTNYEALLGELNSLYDQGNEDQRNNILRLASALNTSWLKRYQPEYEGWLMRTNRSTNAGIVLGWVTYAGAFATEPQLRHIPFLNRFFRLRAAWSLVAVTSASAGAAITGSSAFRDLPNVPKPPSLFLTLGDNSQAADDSAAVISEAELKSLRSIFASSAGLIAMLSPGPSAASIGSRFLFLRRAMSALRVTPASLVIGLVVEETVELAVKKYQVSQLVNDFASFDESGLDSGQLASIHLNTLELYFLNDTEAPMMEAEKTLRALFIPDNREAREEFLRNARTSPYFQYLEQPKSATSEYVFVTDLQNRYSNYLKQLNALAHELIQLKQRSGLSKNKIAMINRRLTTLADRRRLLDSEAQKMDPLAVVSRIKQIYSPLKPFGNSVN